MILPFFVPDGAFRFPPGGIPYSPGSLPFAPGSLPYSTREPSVVLQGAFRFIQEAFRIPRWVLCYARREIAVSPPSPQGASRCQTSSMLFFQSSSSQHPAAAAAAISLQECQDSGNGVKGAWAGARGMAGPSSSSIPEPSCPV